MRVCGFVWLGVSPEQALQAGRYPVQGKIVDQMNDT